MSSKLGNVASPPAAPELGLAYILFNANWDTVVRNAMDQSLRPITSAQSHDLYLAYLAHSLQSLVACHRPSEIQVTVWLVELARGGVRAEQVQARVAQAVPGLKINICIVGNPAVDRFVQHALSQPPTTYRSPNVLHEFLLLLVLRHSITSKLALVDPDTCFLRTGALQFAFDQLQAHPGRWVAAFMERGKQQPYANGFVPARERMHSVALFFDRLAFVRGFLDVFDWSGDVMRAIRELANEDAREYYERMRALDTLSLLTDYLKYNCGSNRILALNDVCRFVEKSNLTLLSDWLAHSKHLTREALSPLQQAVHELQLPPDELPELARLMMSAARAAAPAQS
jgi:hypothetical protein